MVSVTYGFLLAVRKMYAQNDGARAQSSFHYGRNKNEALTLRSARSVKQNGVMARQQ